MSNKPHQHPHKESGMQAELRGCSWQLSCSGSFSSGLRCRQAVIPFCFAS